MRHLLLPFFLLFISGLSSCKNPENENPTNEETTVVDRPLPPDELFGQLFTVVQMEKIFGDGKTFVDCTPRFPSETINRMFADKRNSPDFNLKGFVEEHFDMPDMPPAISIGNQKDIRGHIEALWPLLLRQPASVPSGSSLLPLPEPYIVPGGRFREIYYWDSYFTMLGLKVSGRTDIMENMVANFAYLIRTYGHIPNGNRTYYLSRSQPPFFSLMVALLANAKNNEAILTKYLGEIEAEYMFWMAGDREVKPGEALRRVVKLKEGIFMNRYCDSLSTPRPESYREDRITGENAAIHAMAGVKFADSVAANNFKQTLMKQVWNNLRSGAESGWDFSSRWFAKEGNIESIRTTSILPVDLNSLLYYTESLLSKEYRKKGDTKKADDYEKWAKERGDAILKYCWNEELGFFTDYDWENGASTRKITAAGFFPLCLLDTGYLQKIDMAAIAKATEKELLAAGGLLTTPLSVKAGEQWDNPNGWAPLQWMAVWGLDRAGNPQLAGEIAHRWIALNKKVFDKTGKLMEKYNVVNTTLEAGGGEYPGQDGFGWTNGVLLALMEKYGG